jgi:hypothetical protein
MERMSADNSGSVYVATETYSAIVDGAPHIVHKGKTRCREGHTLITQNPQWWRLAGDDVHFDVETAEAVPGEKRSAPATATKSTGRDK